MASVTTPVGPSSSRRQVFVKYAVMRVTLGGMFRHRLLRNPASRPALSSPTPASEELVIPALDVRRFSSWDELQSYDMDVLYLPQSANSTSTSTSIDATWGRTALVMTTSEHHAVRSQDLKMWIAAMRRCGCRVDEVTVVFVVPTHEYDDYVWQDCAEEIDGCAVTQYVMEVPYADVPNLVHVERAVQSRKRDVVGGGDDDDEVAKKGTA